MSKKLINSLIISSSLSLLLILSTGGAFAKSCYKCHKDKKQEFSKKYVHSPVEEESCTDCHLEHEQGKPEKLALTAEGNELCAECHDGIADKKHVHSAIAEGSCTDCHNPHASDNPKQLIATGNELCEGCHDDIADKKHVHSAIAEGSCTDCHSPHSSDNPKQLAATGKELCYGCHDNKEESEYVHPALAEGDCTDCHSPHSSENRLQFTANYTGERYVNFSSKEYALCFSCHEESLVTSESTTTDTNFRQEDANLHYVHVHGKSSVNKKYGIKRPVKGRTCSNCHIGHGSDQPFMIRQTYEKHGKIVYSIEYTKSRDGGSCVVGCHVPRGYDRQKGTDRPPNPTISGGKSAPDAEAAESTGGG